MSILWVKMGSSLANKKPDLLGLKSVAKPAPSNSVRLTILGLSQAGYPLVFGIKNN